jgi:hypothetical protein
MAGFEDGEENHESRNVVTFPGWERQGSESPVKPPEGT